MSIRSSAFAAVAAFGSLIGPALGQGGVSVIALEDPESVPAPPTCDEPPSYLLASDTAGLWSASTITQGVIAEAGLFAVTDEQIIATGVEVDMNGRTGFCSWVLVLGEFSPSGEAPRAAGMIRADVVLTGGGEFETFSIGTELPPALAEDAIAAAREAVVIVVPEGEPLPEGALGSSCSCPACPAGGRFWIPFTVIGIGQVPGGISCCSTACTTACSRLSSGISEAEAWLIGQGTWVACMICQ